MKKRASKREKSTKSMRTYGLRLAALAMAILIMDRAFKLYLKDSCMWTLCIKRAANYGAAFGIFEGWTFFLVLAAIAVLILIALLYQGSRRPVKLALTLITAGTVSNLVDRIFYGHVIDLFSIFGSSSFNLADLSNLAGAAILVFFLWRGEKR